jgi:hypothetical protein
MSPLTEASSMKRPPRILRDGVFVWRRVDLPVPNLAGNQRLRTYECLALNQ